MCITLTLLRCLFLLIAGRDKILPFIQHFGHPSGAPDFPKLPRNKILNSSDGVLAYVRHALLYQKAKQYVAANGIVNILTTK